MQAWVVLLLLAFIPTVRGQPSYGEFEAAAAARADLGLDGAISTAEGNDTFSVQDIRERVSSPWPGISGRNAGFVSTSGPNFILGGNPWYCAGTSAYYAALEWIMSENEVEVMMREHARQGATVLRVFAHNNFWPEPQVMMRFFGQYNETNIRRLDLVLAAAADNGIRLIMTLGNHWKFTGGEEPRRSLQRAQGRTVRSRSASACCRVRCRCATVRQLRHPPRRAVAAVLRG
jgi:hypothetical protein